MVDFVGVKDMMGVGAEWLCRAFTSMDITCLCKGFVIFNSLCLRIYLVVIVEHWQRGLYSSPIVCGLIITIKI